MNCPECGRSLQIDDMLDGNSRSEGIALTNADPMTPTRLI